MTLEIYLRDHSSELRAEAGAEGLAEGEARAAKGFVDILVRNGSAKSVEEARRMSGLSTAKAGE